MANDAKRQAAIHNARMQLLATALNNLGVGAILAGIIAPTVNGSLGDVAHIVMWVVFGVELILLGHVCLGGFREP